MCVCACAAQAKSLLAEMLKSRMEAAELAVQNDISAVSKTGKVCVVCVDDSFVRAACCAILWEAAC
jgi:hypothetical protein